MNGSYRVCLYLYLGACEDSKLSPDGPEHRKPKQTRPPAPAYVDLPLWQDGQGETPAAAESPEEGASGSPAAGTPQLTPTNSLSRSPPRKRTESALLRCGALLASVALGVDLTERHAAQAAEELVPREERRRRERSFPRAPRARSGAGAPGRPPGRGGGPGGAASPAPPSALSLLSAPSLSTKCLLQPEGEDSCAGGAHGPADPAVPVRDVGPASAPCREADRGVWRHLRPPFSEQTRGNSAARHRRSVSDGSASQAPRR